MMDKFPEAFRRFEKDVPIDQFKSYRDMSYGFAHWAGKRWVDSYLQNKALTVEGEKLGYKDIELPRYFHARARKEKWAKSYKKRAKKRRKAVKKKYKGVGKVRINALGWYVSSGYSANKIQKRLKDRGLGIQRKKLLKIVRELRMKPKKADAKKYTPKKYRKKKSKKKRKKVL